MNAAEMSALSVVHWIAVNECRAGRRRHGLFLNRAATWSLYYPPVPGLATGRTDVFRTERSGA